MIYIFEFLGLDSYNCDKKHFGLIVLKRNDNILYADVEFPKIR